MRARRATQADVAREAGVSVATVSYVASGRRDRKNPATPEITRRVLAAMAKLDYTPARAGRVLARNRTGLIAVATYTPFNPWALGVINQLEEVAAGHGLGVIIQHYGHTTSAADRIESHLLEGIADAALVLGGGFESARMQRIGRHIPVLAMSESYRPRGFDVLVQRESAAARLAGEHLISLGVRRPAFLLHGHTAGHRSHPRMEGFISAFTAHGLPRSAITVAEDRDDTFAGFLDARHVATGLLDQPKRRRPDAIMAHSDRAAISVIWAATQLGISIPDELKVIGAGNIAEGTAIRPTLTTVGNEMEEFRPALERLILRIDDAAIKTKTLTVPWRLIRRETA
jgi:DNA-binding LacI/PurR family transcriptional regulator